ncbi:MULTISPECIES: pyridoxamine 5'-phosphate oxidase [Natrinema]|uniref:Pyridoxamine 5'-phosphate oxidase-related FMN-binding protein n=1 Tax=Natrinema gari JCM 14663 TaxID=1230459 RepID=L9Z105_9EURY|nr:MULTISPECIES: pyridoxamine 5'-phosphate oxidase [Natrinema]AFO58076.1 pyridoxamine 5'-phosphate oxidase-related FMN-binding protein [Natrinema sp. J7-2]ELY80039.1 pyridoxamine 5'-phosphate oxidase-related FMN-binding protein [Natrinema gari JCM 14663]
MTDFRGAWTEADVETFLRETTVPIRLGTRRPDGSLWLVTLWVRYRDGTLECATQANADVVRFLRNDPEIGFDISTNDIPYRGIRGTGTADIEPDGKPVLRDLVERYLGGTDSPLAEWLLAEDREEVTIRIEPREVYSWDYSDRMGDDSDATTE